MKRWTARLALLSALFLAPQLAQAQSPQDVEKQVNRMNKRAMEDYDALEFESARKTLVDAVAMLRSAGLDEGPVAAKTYVNLGMVYISGFKDRNRGIQQFVNALRINPSFKLDPAVATPELDEALAQALKQVGKQRHEGGGEPTPPEPAPTPPPSAPEVKGLVHQPVDEARPGSPIPIHAQLGSDVGASRVFLFYRAGGQEDYVSVPMKNTSGVEWVGVIPGDATSGKALQYYLEARDARGRPVVGSGSGPSPYIIALSESAPPPANVPEVDVEDPLMRERARKKRLEEEKHGKRDHIFLFAMPGFGFGVEPAGNHTEVAWQFQSQSMQYVQQPVGTAGIALAPFHLLVEAGWLVTNHLSLSAVARFQPLTGANAQTVNPGSANNPTTKANGAVAGFLRLRYRFLDGRFHPYIQANLGGGEIRHALDISGAEPQNGKPLVDQYSATLWNNSTPAMRAMLPPGQEVCSNHANCVDTIALGYFFVGAGGGLWYDVAAHFALILDVNLLGAIGTGDHQSGFNIDVSAGIGAHFL